MFRHETVLREEVTEFLDIYSEGIYVDCTLGGGGHSSSIAERLDSSGILIGLDQDVTALKYAKQRLEDVHCKTHFVKSNFRNVREVVESLDICKVNGIVFDLGVSSPQLDEGERGFSYHQDAPLDMRMDQNQEFSAYDIVNEWGEEELVHVLREYGEERYAKRIARKIIKRRSQQHIRTTHELAETIRYAFPPDARWASGHPARRSFQAIRIAVNDELAALKSALTQAVEILQPKGRLCVITFHSLEDRICKKYFQEQARGCICDPKIPLCVCNHQPNVKIVTRKPVVPSEKEIEINKRARSAKLRVVEKI